MRLLEMLMVRAKKEVTEDDVMNIFSVVAKAKTPAAQRAIRMALPVKISLIVMKSDFGDQVPVELLSLATFRGGRGIPQVQTSFLFNGQNLHQQRTDEAGAATVQHVFTAPGKCDVRSVIGPVVEQNQAYAQQTINILEAAVDSPIPVEFTADNKQFTAPAKILSISPRTLKFPQIVNRGENDGWLLLSPSSLAVSQSTVVSLQYVKPFVYVSPLPAQVTPQTTVQLEATLKTDVTGQPIPNEPITFKLGTGQEIATVMTNAQGVASWVLLLPEGSYLILTSWRGINFGQPQIIQSTIAVTPPPAPPIAPSPSAPLIDVPELTVTRALFDWTTGTLWLDFDWHGTWLLDIYVDVWTGNANSASDLDPGVYTNFWFRGFVSPGIGQPGAPITQIRFRKHVITEAGTSYGDVAILTGNKITVVGEPWV